MSSTQTKKEEKSQGYIIQDESKRFRCEVESLRPGWDHFELVAHSHKNKNRPIVVRGRCGEVIEEGLTQFMIDCLENSHHTESKASGRVDPTKDMGVIHKKTKVPHYRVKVLGEVSNPKEVGKVK